MALICFASQKGSPGVTLTALTVTAALPLADGRRKVLLEADADGGSLAARYQLGRQPGLVTLAAASRHGLGREDIWAHAQALPCGLAAIVAPERADRATSVLATSAKALAPWLASLAHVDVIVDCGRLSPSSPALPFAHHADAVFMVIRPVAEQVQPAAERALALQGAGRWVAWVLIGERPYSAADVAEATGIAVAAVLPDDPRSAEALLRGGSSSRLRRSPLVRAATSFAAQISAQIRPAEPVEPSAAPINGARLAEVVA